METFDSSAAYFGSVLSAKELERIFRFCTNKTVEAGTALYCQGEPTDALYFIETGRVALSKHSGAQPNKPHSMARNGDVLGKALFTSGALHDFSATCVDRTKLRVLSKRAGNRLSREYPNLSVKLLSHLAEQSANKTNKAPAKVVSFFSPRGGSGKSFLASAYASISALRHGYTVAVVELDLQFGDLATYFSCEPAWTMGELLATEDIFQIQPSEVLRYCAAPCPNVRLLCKPRDIAHVETVSVPQVVQIVRKLEQCADLVVLDTRTGLDDFTLSALDLSDTVYLVATTERAGVKAAASARSVVEELGYAEGKLQLLLNRSNDENDLPSYEISRLLGSMIGTVIPNDASVAKALNEQRFWARSNLRSPITRKLTALSSQLTAPAKRLPQEELKQSFISGLFSWWKKGKEDNEIELPKATYTNGALSERLGESLLAVGQAHFLSGRFEKARRTLLRAISEDVRLSRAHEYLAQMAHFDEDTKRAVNHYRQAAQHDPNSYKARVNLAIHDSDFQEGDKVLEDLQRACLSASAHSDKRYLLARLLHHRDDNKGAHRSLEQALATNPTYTDALVFQAKLFFEERRYVSALSSLLKAIKARDCCIQAYYLLGALFEKLDLLEFSRQSYRRVLTSYGGHHLSHESLLALLEPLSLVRLEVENYGEAAAINPTFGDLRFKRAYALYQLGDFDKALFELTAATAVGYSQHKIEALRRQVEKFAHMLDKTFVYTKRKQKLIHRLAA